MKRVVASCDAGAFLHSALGRGIVQLLLAQRGVSDFFIHACGDMIYREMVEELRRDKSCGGGDDGGPSLFKCYLACHASAISSNGVFLAG